MLGWFLLGGRCRGCRGAISPRYVLVELATGASFAGVYLSCVALRPSTSGNKPARSVSSSGCWRCGR